MPSRDDSSSATRLAMQRSSAGTTPRSRTDLKFPGTSVPQTARRDRDGDHQAASVRPGGLRHDPMGPASEAGAPSGPGFTSSKAVASRGTATSTRTSRSSKNASPLLSAAPPQTAARSMGTSSFGGPGRSASTASIRGTTTGTAKGDTNSRSAAASSSTAASTKVARSGSRLRELVKEEKRVRKEREERINAVGSELRGLLNEHIGLASRILQQYPALGKAFASAAAGGLTLTKASELLKCYLIQNRILHRFFAKLPYVLRAEIERKLGGLERVKAPWQIERVLQLMMTDETGTVTPEIFDDTVALIRRNCDELLQGSLDFRQQRIAAFLLEHALTKQLVAWDSEIETIEAENWTAVFDLMDERLAGIIKLDKAVPGTTASSGHGAQQQTVTTDAPAAQQGATAASSAAAAHQGELSDEASASTEKAQKPSAAAKKLQAAVKKLKARPNPTFQTFGDDEDYLLDLRDELLRRMEWENGVYGLVLRRAKNSYLTVRKTMEKRVPTEPYEITVPDFASALDLVLRGKKEMEFKVEHFRLKAQEMNKMLVGYVSRRKIPDWEWFPGMGKGRDGEDNWRPVWDAVLGVELFPEEDERGVRIVRGKVTGAKGNTRADAALELMQDLDKIVQLLCDVRDEIKKCPVWEIEAETVSAPLSHFVSDLSALSERLLEILDFAEPANRSFQESAAAREEESPTEGDRESGTLCRRKKNPYSPAREDETSDDHEFAASIIAAPEQGSDALTLGAPRSLLYEGSSAASSSRSGGEQQSRTTEAPFFFGGSRSASRKGSRGRARLLPHQQPSGAGRGNSSGASSRSSSVVALPPIPGVDGRTSTTMMTSQKASGAAENVEKDTRLQDVQEASWTQQAGDKLCRQWNDDFSHCVYKHSDPVRRLFQEHGAYFVKRRTFLNLQKFKTVAAETKKIGEIEKTVDKLSTNVNACRGLFDKVNKLAESVKELGNNFEVIAPRIQEKDDENGDENRARKVPRREEHAGTGQTSEQLALEDCKNKNPETGSGSSGQTAAPARGRTRSKGGKGKNAKGESDMQVDSAEGGDKKKAS